jgi:flagellar basal body-associated protein FliL
MSTKNYIALLLLALISVKTILVPVVYLDFELRKDYIIKNLCENRFKPQLHCDGQCVLAKKLHQLAEENATKETQKQGQAIKKVLEEVFESTPSFSLNLANKNLSKKSVYSHQLAHYQSFTPSVFHPPA